MMDSTSMSKQSSFININSMRQYITNKDSKFAAYPFIDYDSNLDKIGVQEFTWSQFFNPISFFKLIYLNKINE